MERTNYETGQKVSGLSLRLRSRCAFQMIILVRRSGERIGLSVLYGCCSLPARCLSYHTVWCHAMSCRNVPQHSGLDHAIPYHSIPYHSIPYHSMPYHSIPYHAVERRSHLPWIPARCERPRQPPPPLTPIPSPNPILHPDRSKWANACWVSKSGRSRKRSSKPRGTGAPTPTPTLSYHRRQGDFASASTPS